MPARRPSRKQARRDAVFVLYQHDVTSVAVDELLETRAASEGYVADEFTTSAVLGVLERVPELDRELNAHSPKWPVDRIAPLERSILRLALHEIDVGETPPEVAIDEAVRLAKRYSTNEAAGLVNGILAAALRDRRADEPDIAGQERTR